MAAQHATPSARARGAADGTHRRKALRIREAAALVGYLWKGSLVPLGALVKTGAIREARQEASVARPFGLPEADNARG